MSEARRTLNTRSCAEGAAPGRDRGPSSRALLPDPHLTWGAPSDSGATGQPWQEGQKDWSQLEPLPAAEASLHVDSRVKSIKIGSLCGWMESIVAINVTLPAQLQAVNSKESGFSGR